MIKLNSNFVNAKIKGHILSDEEMKAIRFHKNYYEGTKYEKYSPHWYYISLFGKDISFNVDIPKDGSDINIMILDENFLQPYDYQAILEKDSTCKFALEVKEFVENEMSYLQHAGVLSGHIRGEYI